MEPFERFSEQKLEYLRRRYRGDDLFRTWTRLLCILEQQLHGLNAVEVWSETEMVRQRLSEIKDHRDNDVEFLYGDLMKRHQSKYTVATILTVLFTQMCDAAPDEEDDAAERNPNRAICNVLARLLMLRDIKPFSEKLISAFKSHRYDNEENKIILPVTDYMDVKTPLELMDEEAREQVEKWVEGIDSDMYEEDLQAVHNAAVVKELGWPEQTPMLVILANPLMAPYIEDDSSVREEYEDALKEVYGTATDASAGDADGVDYVGEYNADKKAYYSQYKNVQIEEMSGPSRLYTYDPDGVAKLIKAYLDD